ncbi:MAG: ParB/RepB/Spo0J family partition protein, partial [Beijerinckiaceae bacterium]
MTNITNTTMTTVALSKLTASNANVRRVESDAGLTELCASIKAHGLLQNLTVRKGNKGKYEVVAGARRLAALRALANQPESGFDRASLIPVHVLEGQNDTEISLAENTVRVNMHVADQIEAFRKLIEEDAMTPEQVGDRIGISHMTVRRRVKLAKVSPRIMDEFRSGKASLQQMEALAVADDHGAQEDAYFNLPEWNRDERNIRARLTSEKISADNRLVQFVGLDAYRAAGGTITQDLFSENADTYLDSKAIVMTLVAARLEAAAAIVQAEGWKWAEYYSSERECGQHLPTIPSFKREHTEAENAEVAEIMAFIEAFEPAYEAGQMTPEEKAEYEGKIARMDQIDAACIGHDPELMGFAGVRLFLNYQGEITVLRGLLKSAEQHELAARERAKRQAEAEAVKAASATSDDETVSEAEAPELHNPMPQPEQDMADGYSMALISDLTATRTAALAFEVSQRPDIGLALAVHALALRTFYEDRYGQGYGYGNFEASCVRIAGTKQPRPIGTADPDNEAPFAAFREAKERLQAKLPEQKHELFAWCLAAEQKVLLDMLA